MVNQIECEPPLPLVAMAMPRVTASSKLMDIEFRALELLAHLNECIEERNEDGTKLIRNKNGGRVQIRDSWNTNESEYSENRMMITPSGLLGICVGFSLGHQGKQIPWFFVEKDCGISCFEGHISALVKSGFKFPYN